MTSTETASAPVRGVPALIATIVGAVIMAWSFVSGVSAALNGGGDGATVYVILFLAAGALVLAGLVFGIVNLVRGRSRAIAVATIVIGLLPVIAVIVLRVTAIS